MKLTTEQLERIAKMMPSEWEAEAQGDLLSYSPNLIGFIWNENYGDCPHIVNWALNELVARISVELVGNEDGWRVTVFDVGDKPNQGLYYVGEGETKTEALVMALMEVCCD